MRTYDTFTGPVLPSVLIVLPVSDGPCPIGWRIFSIVDGKRGRALDFYQDRLEANRMAADSYAIMFDYHLLTTNSRPVLKLAEAPDVVA